MSDEVDLVRWPDDIIKTIIEKPDARPQWLRKLPGASRADQAPYYRFLYEYMRQRRPAIVLETGTNYGVSALHMSAGCKSTRVITIDISHKRLLQLVRDNPSITPILGDSTEKLEAVQKLLAGESVDFLFIDSQHSMKHAAKEWNVFGLLCRRGALQCFDDVCCDRFREHVTPSYIAQAKANGHSSPKKMSEDMDRFWAWLPEPKRLVNSIHPGSGFGMRIAA